MTYSLLEKPHAFERDDSLYIVAPLTTVGPKGAEIEELAFSKQLLAFAPNTNIMWLEGAYVEAGRPNANGAMWLSEELALKSLTPRLMPVTVMHDPRTAVGMIADAKLVSAEDEQASNSRSRIETTLGVWAHRFPEIAEECLDNYEQGSLMQSMECQVAHETCSVCGQSFPRLPGNAEQAYWCKHLKGETEDGVTAARILGNVTFTGVGLIFGSRGSEGAYDDAHLTVFQDEVAEFHAKASERPRHRAKPKRSTSSMDTIEIPKSEYAELQQRPTREAFAELEERAEAAEAAKVAAEKDLEAAETAKVAAEEAKEAAEKSADELRAEKEATELASERMGKLGAGFLAKLGDKTKARIAEQSKAMKDDEWAARLDELAELVGVSPETKGASGDTMDNEFTSEEIASSKLGAPDGEPSAGPNEERAIFSSLLKA